MLRSLLDFGRTADILLELVPVLEVLEALLDDDGDERDKEEAGRLHLFFRLRDEAQVLDAVLGELVAHGVERGCSLLPR